MADLKRIVNNFANGDKSYVLDFMDGVGRNGSKDKLHRMTASQRNKVSPITLNNMYADNRIIQNVIDIPAEDMTRNWFTLRMQDDKLAANLMSKLADLNAKDVFKQMMQFERLQGDGFISIGVTQNEMFEIADELPQNVKSVDYLHAFSSLKVSEFLINEDVFSQNYGSLSGVKIDRSSKHGISTSVQGQVDVHMSRLLHARTRLIEGELQGQSLLEAMNDIFKVFDTTLWSIGQILSDYTLKVYKSADIDGMSADDKAELGMILGFMTRTEAMAIIGAEEELTKQATNVSGIKDLIDFVWDILASSARMPKTVLKGQESGTIAGAQYDVMNYYARIAADQENIMKPLLERLLRIIMQSDEFGINPESIEWEIKFNPLWQVDSETDAKIRKMNAETDQIYIVNGVHTVDDVAKARFGQFGLVDESKFSGDSVDFEDIAKSIYKSLTDKKGE